MLFKLRVLVKIVLTLVLLDHKLSYLHVLQCSHHSSSFFTIVFISFSPGDPLALGPLPLGYPNGKYNNNNNNSCNELQLHFQVHRPSPFPAKCSHCHWPRPPLALGLESVTSSLSSQAGHMHILYNTILSV